MAQIAGMDLVGKLLLVGLVEAKSNNDFYSFLDRAVGLLSLVPFLLPPTTQQQTYINNGKQLGLKGVSFYPRAPVTSPILYIIRTLPIIRGVLFLRGMFSCLGTYHKNCFLILIAKLPTLNSSK